MDVLERGERYLRAAVELKAAPRAGWVGGMCSLPDEYGRVWRANGCPGDSGFGFTQVLGLVQGFRCDTSALVPDCDDPGTEGYVANVVRKVLGEPNAYARPTFDHKGNANGWCVWHPSRPKREMGRCGGTRAEAWIAELEAKCGDTQAPGTKGGDDG